jgi:hypothetical protein
MYLLFKSVPDNQLGIIKRYGHFLDYVVGYLDDSVRDLVEVAHLNPTVISTQAVADAWKFAGNWTGYLTVKANTASNEQLDNIVSSGEADAVKVRYYLTDDDKTNTVEFMRIAMRKILDDVYDKRMQHLNLHASALEEASWDDQRTEAFAYAQDNTTSVPTLTVLAAARGITVQEMSTKVVNAVNSYNASIASLLASKQTVESEIKACLTIQDCNLLLHNRYGYTMPYAQQEQLGITHPAAVNL